MWLFPESNKSSTVPSGALGFLKHVYVCLFNCMMQNIWYIIYYLCRIHINMCIYCTYSVYTYIWTYYLIYVFISLHIRIIHLYIHIACVCTSQWFTQRLNDTSALGLPLSQRSSRCNSDRNSAARLLRQWWKPRGSLRIWCYQMVIFLWTKAGVVGLLISVQNFVQKYALDTLRWCNRSSFNKGTFLCMDPSLMYFQGHTTRRELLLTS